ncbi:acetyltransferase [Aquibium carbonis]|uniref:Acetyltransferase n=2 Tax=Aquibium carbonis TaxID=2495581 RepID=A0A3R9Y7V0_9HYPH|nr:acetyltransferase [Aquibium carbonis]
MLDVSANRASRKWSRREQAGRVAWALVQPVFSLSPRPFWGWRRFLLRLFGARIGAQVHIHPSVRIAIPWNIEIGDETAVGDRVILYSLGRISLGRRTTISQGAHLCAGTHDWRRPDRPLMKPPIHVEDDAWVCADAFVGPAVTVGAGAIVGARAVVMRDVPAMVVVTGNPAREIRKLVD